MKKETILFVLILLSLNLQAQEILTKNSKAEYVETDDSVKLYLKKSGQGPVCIFIHGGPGAWSRSFEDLGGNNLEKKLTMVYYDQRGCGRSENSPDEDYSLNRMVEDIEQIRKHLKAEKVYLLSHSFGGILAVNYALKYHDHVKGLLLANSTLNVQYSLNEQIKYINKLVGTKFTAMNDDVIPTFLKAKKVLGEKGLDYKRLSDDKLSVEKLEEIDRQNQGTYEFARNGLAIKDYLKDYTEFTREITCPVLVITGTKDNAIGVKHHKSFEFPHEKVVKIDGGHILYYEQNAEFITAIFSFVDKIETNYTALVASN